MEAVNRQLKFGEEYANFYFRKRVKEQDKNKMGYSTTKQSIDPTLVESKLEVLLSHVEELERKISCKANEVVEYQVLQQRSELDDLFKIMQRIEERMQRLESGLAKSNNLIYEPVLVPRKNRKK